MNVYLSARYARLDELACYREQLAAVGIDCSCRWLTGSTVDGTAENAQIDVDDIYAADVFVTFTEEPVEFSPLSYASRGGRHVEFGIAYETGMPVVVIGPKENVFHLLPDVIHADTWDEALALLRTMAESELDARWSDIVTDIGGEG